MNVARKSKPQTSRATDFELPDQFQKTHALNFPRDQVCVLVFGDRQGAEHLQAWIEPVYYKFPGQIEIYGVAELSAVPALVRPLVRQMVKSRTKYAVLLDWTGQVAQSYGYEVGQSLVLVIDKAGNIVIRKTGTANQKDLNAIYRQIQKKVMSDE